jgi:hypothetical protein
MKMSRKSNLPVGILTILGNAFADLGGRLPATTPIALVRDGSETGAF